MLGSKVSRSESKLIKTVLHYIGKMKKMVNTAFKNNYFHYQTGSDRKNMIPPTEYFEMIKSTLIK